jgi:ABC-type molybdate transport system substrate-binding protein
MVRLPLFDAAVQQVTIGVLTASRQPTAALRFTRYLGARDRGLLEFARQHYEPVEGDEWAEMPDIKLFSGAMLRPAIEKTLRDFEAREGVRITTVYNGCGILTAQMRAGERPDAYFACDSSFMNSVADMYLTPVTVAGNPMVILVAKGNPLGLRSLADLTRPGLRLGFGHPDKSALGALTRRLLESKGLYDASLNNLKVDSATGDFLVNQLRTGSLDAVVVYRSNAHAVREYLDTVEIEDRLANATQPYAVGRATKYRHLMGRLQSAFVAAESRQQFESAGFNWKATP